MYVTRSDQPANAICNLRSHIQPTATHMATGWPRRRHQDGPHRHRNCLFTLTVIYTQKGPANTSVCDICYWSWTPRNTVTVLSTPFSCAPSSQAAPTSPPSVIQHLLLANAGVPFLITREEAWLRIVNFEEERGALTLNVLVVLGEVLKLWKRANPKQSVECGNHLSRHVPRICLENDDTSNLLVSFVFQSLFLVAFTIYVEAALNCISLCQKHLHIWSFLRETASALSCATAVRLSICCRYLVVVFGGIIVGLSCSSSFSFSFFLKVSLSQFSLFIFSSFFQCNFIDYIQNVLFLSICFIRGFLIFRVQGSWSSLLTEI